MEVPPFRFRTGLALVACAWPLKLNKISRPRQNSTQSRLLRFFIVVHRFQGFVRRICFQVVISLLYLFGCFLKKVLFLFFIILQVGVAAGASAYKPEK